MDCKHSISQVQNLIKDPIFFKFLFVFVTYSLDMFKLLWEED